MPGENHEAGQPLEEPTRTQASSGSEEPARTLGPYRLLEKIGEGGMGEVWVAQQSSPFRRKVAVKIIKRGMDTKQVIARFEAERQALALMDHPAIAKVFDAGETPRGRPFFVMEYVQGVPITEHCDRQRLSTRERLDLFVQICNAVQHAHQKAIIHRDLKPSNVLVAMQDGKSVPKIIDFGVAKATAQRLTEKTLFTELGVLIGTPEYMSPEQAELTAQDVDTRTDVYSLGGILYELLVGALPFDPKGFRRAGFDEIRRRIREVEPSKPSVRVRSLGDASLKIADAHRADPRSLEKQLHGDLDWIVMKALEKDRSRRYASALELATDIGRHIRHEPVLAGPPSAPYRLRKFIRRHRVGVAAGVVVLAALLGGMTAAVVGLVRATRAEKRAQDEAEKATREAKTAKQVSDFLVRLFEVSDPLGGQSALTVREVLDEGARKLDEMKDQPKVRARLESTIGTVYLSLGFYDKARSLLEEALTIQEDEGGLDLARTMRSLAHLLDITGDRKDPWPLYQRSLDISEKVLGPDHPDVALILLNMADNLRERQRDFEKAQDYFERSIAIYEKVGDPRLSWSLNDYAFLKGQIGDEKGSQTIFERSLAVAEKAYGPDHPSVALPLANLSGIYTRQGDFTRARQALERALSVFEKKLGPHHGWVYAAYVRLGEIELKTGNYRKAREYFENALAINEKQPQTAERTHQEASNLWHVATAERLQGDFRESEATYRRALVLEREFHGEGSAVYLVKQAGYHAVFGRRKEALDLLGRSLEQDPANKDVDVATDPDFETLHGDPEFEAIVSEYKNRIATKVDDATPNMTDPDRR